MGTEDRQKLMNSLQVHRVPSGKRFAATATLQGLIQAGGFGPYQLAVITANAIANSVLGHGLSLTANALLTKSIAVFAGPIGWVLSALWGTKLIAGPAYRVIMPCILQVAVIRQAALARERAARKKNRILRLILGLILVLLIAFIVLFESLH